MACIEIDSSECEDDLSEDVKHALMSFGWKVFCPDGFDEMEAYEHVKRGRCISCGATLGEHTQLVVGNVGILAIWCNGQCMSDQLAVGFLQQVEAELVETIEARGKDA